MERKVDREKMKALVERTVEECRQQGFNLHELQEFIRSLEEKKCTVKRILTMNYFDGATFSAIDLKSSWSSKPPYRL